MLTKHAVHLADARDLSFIASESVHLRFRATNMPPYPFEWVDEAETQVEYAAALARISREYGARF